MNARLLAGAAVTLILLAAGCGNGNDVSLRQVEAAFARNGLRFPCDWQLGGSNRPGCGIYFVRGKRGKGVPVPRGGAFAVSMHSGVIRFADVFDSAAAASLAAAYWRKNPGRGYAIIVVKNVLYVGVPSAAARRAMESLRK
jgi:hypothetical protein